MATLSAVSAFRKGLEALIENRFAEASAHFHRALQLEQPCGGSGLYMRYLSYYGLSLTLAGLSDPIARIVCRVAAFRQPDDPVVQLNLERVYRIAGEPRSVDRRKELAWGDRCRLPAAPFLHGSDRNARLSGRSRIPRLGRTTGVGYASRHEIPH